MKLHVLPAQAGVDWFKAGVRLFLRQPLALAGLFFMFFLFTGLLAMLVPLLGPLLALALVPAGTVGMMAACHEVAQQRPPMPAVLLTALRTDAPRRRAVLVLGAVYVSGLLLAMLAAMLTEGGALLRELMAAPDQAAAQALLRERQRELLAPMAVMMTLQLLLTALLWFAPALVHWRRVPALKSLFFSAVVFWRNWRAFALFALASGGAMLALVAAVMLLGGALGQPALALRLAQPLALLFTVISFPCMLLSFQDCFGPLEDEAAAPAPPGAG